MLKQSFAILAIGFAVSCGGSDTDSDTPSETPTTSSSVASGSTETICAVLALKSSGLSYIKFKFGPGGGAVDSTSRSLFDEAIDELRFLSDRAEDRALAAPMTALADQIDLFIHPRPDAGDFYTAKSFAAIDKIDAICDF